MIGFRPAVSRANFNDHVKKSFLGDLQKEPRHAQCTTLFPANGGCGNTTLAIQTAFLLAGTAKEL